MSFFNSSTTFLYFHRLESFYVLPFAITFPLFSSLIVFLAVCFFAIVFVYVSYFFFISIFYRRSCDS